MKWGVRTNMALSSVQFGDDSEQRTGQMFQEHPQTEPPLSLSSLTNSTFKQATTWRRPAGASLSAQTGGSVLKFGDDQTTIPKLGE